MSVRIVVNMLTKGFLLSVVLAASMKADIIFSNLTGPANAVGEGVAGGENTVAEAFTPALNYTLTDAQILVASVSDGDPSFNVFVCSNTGALLGAGGVMMGGAPGGFCEGIGFGLIATTGFPGSILTANTIGTPFTLTSGSQYWLVVSKATPDTIVDWVAGGSPSAPAVENNLPGDVWVNAGVPQSLQMQIEGTPVPEPSALLLTGVFCLQGFYAKRRRSRL